MALKIHQPHDSFVRRSLADLETARDLLQAHLAPDIAQRIDWSTLQLTNKRFVKEELAQLHSDFIYKCQLAGKQAYIYCLLEHQSSPDAMLPFRILQYDVSLMEAHLAQGHKKLPVIVNLCLYAGEASPYPYSVDIYDCFEVPDLARRTMFKPLELIDLTVLAEEELAGHGKADLVEILLKQAVVREFLSWINSHQAFVVKLLNRFYGGSGVVYMLETDQKSPAEKLIEAILAAAPNKKELIMTAAQQLRQEGRQQEKQGIAKNMLAKGWIRSSLARWTGLSEEQLQQLTP